VGQTNIMIIQASLFAWTQTHTRPQTYIRPFGRHFYPI